MAALIILAEYLKVDTLPLATPASVITDMSDAWQSAAQRGSDILVPHAAGVSPRRRRKTVTLRAFPITIFGDRDYEGNAHTSPEAGVVENYDQVMALVEPTGTGDGTRTITWHRIDGSEMTAPAHILGLDITRSTRSAKSGVLRMSFPTDWEPAP